MLLEGDPLGNARHVVDLVLVAPSSGTVLPLDCKIGRRALHLIVEYLSAPAVQLSAGVDV